MTFFRVVATRPARAKTVHIVNSQLQRFGRRDICIAFHDSSNTHDGSAIVAVQPRSSGVEPLAALASIESDLNILEVELMAWTRTRSPQFFFKGVPEKEGLGKLIEQLCTCGAFAETEKFLSVSKEEHAKINLLNNLEADGLVDKAAESERSASWRLTRQGMGSISLAHKMVAPTPFFTTREGIAIEDMSSWEMLRALQEGGWNFLRSPPTNRRHTIPSLLPGAEDRSVYVPSASLHHHRKYLACILQSEDMFATGKLLELHHFQMVNYYKKVLAGSSNGKIPVARAALLDAPRPELVPDIQSDPEALEGDIVPVGPVEAKPIAPPAPAAAHHPAEATLEGHLLNVWEIGWAGRAGQDGLD